jgi:hypothetical protein
MGNSTARRCGRALAPLVRQLTTGDVSGRDEAARSSRSATLQPRTATADRVVSSACSYCGVGCGQRVYVKNDAVIQIEGHAVGGPARALAVGGTVLESGVARVMERRLGSLADARRQGRAGAFRRAADAFSVAGAGLRIAGRRSRAASAAGAVSVLASSVCQRL